VESKKIQFAIGRHAVTVAGKSVRVADSHEIFKGMTTETANHSATIMTADCMWFYSSKGFPFAHWFAFVGALLNPIENLLFAMQVKSSMVSSLSW
jgi:hypothetical protein